MPDQDTFFSENLPFAQQQEIDRLCTAFEDAWRSGRSPRIEDYLLQVTSELRRTLLKELIASEIEQRQTAEEAFAIDEYLARFPDDRTAVEAGWALIADRAQRDPSPPSTQDFSRDHDQDTGGARAEAPRTAPQPIPEMIGRYKILRELGEGGFGRVFLAQDTQLQRKVAIKVPGQKRLTSARSIQAFLQEARTAAQLKHSGLVVVHDVQQDADYVYIVQEYIDGQDLFSWKQATNPSVGQIVTLLKEVVDAVGFAHQHDLVHRDLKPANLLIDRQGHPHVADFGLAVDENSQSLRQGEVCGTPAYMSPEQVRGLSHILDGRSDLWSIGVILYELLTDRRPFRGANTAETFENIKRRDPKPLRQIKPEIPSELERICLKCLQKRQTDRYASAAELLEDLDAWLRKPAGVSSTPSPVGVLSGETAATPQSGLPSTGAAAVLSDTRSDKQPPPSIVPKGLRSFDEHDADFFLELLPGARNRDGLPESIRFWKLRIEETDPDKTFRVGLIYGPSGCGKSSLVKAGLLPRLASHVVPVYLEATPEDTELRVLKGLRRRFATIPEELSLPDVLAGIREGRWVPENTKVCLVLDQFEQWLHARRAEQDTQLVQALRHCDGSRLQAVVLVRNDFFLAANRLMQDLEVNLVEGRNMVLTDLFDPLHSRHVLAAFGRAYGRLPERSVELSEEQETFLVSAVESLAQDGKIICVRLALFAEMLKGKPWTTTTLSQVGGTEGLGVTFLEETFSAANASPAHSRHQKAAQQVLRALLPEAGSDIKGNRQSHQALLDASGYAQRPGDFADLIQILDSEIRLITPTVPAGEEVGSSVGADANESVAKIAQPVSTPEKYYQLTHDYLVPSLRDWLTRKQKETRKGRAELRLAERSGLWNAKPENQQLPSWWEDLSIRWLTDRKKWIEPQRRMMRRATRVYGIRSILVLASLVALGSFAVFIRTEVAKQRDATRIEGLVGRLVSAEPGQVPDIVKELDTNPDVAATYLSPLLTEPAETVEARRARLHARLATVSRDPSLIEPLAEELLAGKVTYVLPIRQQLRSSSATLVGPFRNLLRDETADSQRRFRAALALADYVPVSDTAGWTEQDLKFVTEQLVSSNAEFQPLLRDALRPIQGKLLANLERLFADPKATDAQRLGAANAFADYAANDVARLAHLLTLATPEQYAALFPLVKANPAPKTLEDLAQVAATPPPEDLGSMERIPFGQRRANAAVTLLRMGEREKVLPVFEWTDDPESLTQFNFRCRPRKVGVEPLLECLQLVSGGPRDRYPRDSRYALLLALGEFTLQEIPQARRDTLITQLADWYRNDLTCGVHGAAGWLLRQWGQNEAVQQVDLTPVPYSPDREWFTLAIDVTSESKSLFGNLLGFSTKKTFYYTFIVFPAAEYTIGSVADEPERRKSEVRHAVRLPKTMIGVAN